TGVALGPEHQGDTIMNAFTRLSSTFLLSLGLAACSATVAPGPSPDDGPDPTSPNGEESLEIAGAYEVKSAFRITPERLGPSGDFALDLQELADDPIEAIAELLADELGIPSWLSGQVEALIEQAMG